MTDSRGRFDGLQFFQDFGYEPHPGQLEIHLAPHPRRVVACGVRWGKTVRAAVEGFDLTRLKTLDLAFPSSLRGKVTLYAWRILRSLASTVAVSIHDYRDE